MASDERKGTPRKGWAELPHHVRAGRPFSNVQVPMFMVREELARHGLHVVDAKQWAVLEAMKACSTDEVRDMRDLGMAPRMVAYAELARREAEKDGTL